MAFRPNDNHYNDNPDEIEEQFWLAKIISHKHRNNNWIFKVCWFEDQTLNYPDVPSKYVLDESVFAEIPYGSIFNHKIELTQRSNLRTNDLNKIVPICNT